MTDHATIKMVIFLVSLVVWGYVLFNRTPQLDGVKDAFIFRASAALLYVRGTMFFVELIL